MKNIKYTLILYLIAEVIAKLFQFLMLPVSSHFLDVNGVANLSMFVISINFLLPVSTLSTLAAYTLYFNQSNVLSKVKMKQSDFRITIELASILISVLGIVVTFLLYALNKQLSLFNSINIFSSQVFFLILFATLAEFITMVIFSGYRLSFNRTKYLSYFVSYTIFKILLGLVLIYLFHDPVYYLISIIICSFIVFIKSGHYSKYNFELINDIKLMNFLKYSLSMIPVVFASVVFVSVDKFYISEHFSAPVVASYNAMFFMVASLQVVSMAINKSYMPELLKRYSEVGTASLDGQEIKLFAYDLVLIPLILLLIVFGEYFFNLFYDESIQYNNTIAFFFSLTFFLNHKYVLLSNALCLDPKLAKYRALSIMVALLFVFFAIEYFVKSFGVIGVAACFTVAYTLVILSTQVFVSIFVSKYFRLMDTVITLILATLFVYNFIK